MLLIKLAVELQTTGRTAIDTDLLEPVGHLDVARHQVGVRSARGRALGLLVGPAVQTDEMPEVERPVHGESLIRIRRPSTLSRPSSPRRMLSGCAFIPGLEDAAAGTWTAFLPVPVVRIRAMTSRSRKERMVERHRRRLLPRVAARPRPRLVDESRRLQVFVGARRMASAAGVQVSIDAARGGARIAGDQVSGHEPGGVVPPVLAGSEAVDPVHDVLPAQAGVVADDAFALDDGMGLVFPEAVDESNPQNGYVDLAVRPQ